jgi:hypothetical protein
MPWASAYSTLPSGLPCACVSKKPGVTIAWLASIVCFALTDASTSPTKTILSLSTTTSAFFRFEPVPSTTSPPRIRMENTSSDFNTGAASAAAGGVSWGGSAGRGVASAFMLGVVAGATEGAGGAMTGAEGAAFSVECCVIAGAVPQENTNATSESERHVLRSTLGTERGYQIFSRHAQFAQIVHRVAQHCTNCAIVLAQANAPKVRSLSDRFSFCRGRTSELSDIVCAPRFLGMSSLGFLLRPFFS